MTPRRVSILAGLVLCVFLSTARAERILAVDRAPDAGIPIDAATGRPSRHGTVVLDATTGRLASYRLTGSFGTEGEFGRAVALTRLDAQRARPVPVERPASPAVLPSVSPEPAETATARIGTPLGPPTGGLAFLAAGVVGIASWMVRRRLRPAYS